MKRRHYELAAAILAVTVALCACKTDESGPEEPDVSTPFCPPRPGFRVVGMHDTPTGPVIVLVRR